MPRLPSEYFKEHFVITTSGVFSPPALRHVLEVLGPDAVLFAADYPYKSFEEAVSFLDNAAISDEERRKNYQTNAEKLFGLGQTQLKGERKSL